MNQISKDSLDSHYVALLWCGLKYCTHTHTQHDIRPRCTKVKQRNDHGTILPLVYLFAVRVEVKLTLEWHRGLGSFKTIILEPLEHVLSVFGLVDKVPLDNCFTSKPRKNSNSPIMDISNLSVISLANSSLKDWFTKPKIISSTYSWHMKNCPPTLLVKRGGTNFPILNPKSAKNPVRVLIQAPWAC